MPISRISIWISVRRKDVLCMVTGAGRLYCQHALWCMDLFIGLLAWTNWMWLGGVPTWGGLHVSHVFWCDSPRLLDSLWPWCMLLAGFETQCVIHEIYTAAFSECIDGPGLRWCRCNSDFTLPHISQYASSRSGCLTGLGARRIMLGTN